MICTDYFDKAVLVIDDEPILTWAIWDLLEELGFTDIHTASSGEKALQIAAIIMPQLIVSDVNLGPSSITGIDVVSTLRIDKIIPALFVTATDDSNTWDAIHRIGPAVEALSKPVSAEEFSAALERLCHGSQIQT